MNRKNAIILSVVMNSVLLTILLVIGLTSREDDKHASLLVNQEHSLAGGGLSLPLFQEQPLLPLGQVSTPIDESSALTGEPSAHALAAPTHSLPALKTEVAKQRLPEIITLPSIHDQLATSQKRDGRPLTPIQEFAPIKVTVQKGDNLEALARAHQTTASKIKDENQLSSSLLRVGQVLKITPGGANSSTSPPEVVKASIAKTSPERSQTTAPSKEASSMKEEGGLVKYYTVKYGDNPWTIAMKHQIKVKDLLQLNGLNEEKAKKLKPGDKLRIR